jgi:hypothetical protein
VLGFNAHLKFSLLSDQQLRAYYRACMTEELPPPLLAALKKLDEETERQEDATNPTATEIGFD